MNEYLASLKATILAGDADEIRRLTEYHVDTPVTMQEFIDFTRSFQTGLKSQIAGSININGSGGSHIPKPNISSIAGMYLAVITQQKVVKTGSSAYSGLCGSTDFFMRTGLMNPEARALAFEKYDFAYYDYLEVNPWKRFKSIIAENTSLSKLFRQVVFLEYPTDHYFLGITNPRYHDAITKHLVLENLPGRLVTFYTKTDRGIMDECAPGDIYLDNVLFSQTEQREVPLLTTRDEILKTDFKLSDGTEDTDSYWLASLRLTCAMALCCLNSGISYESSLKEFDIAYRRRAVLPLLRIG